MPHPLILQSTLKNMIGQLRSAADEAAEADDPLLLAALDFAADWLSHAVKLIGQKQRRDIEQTDDLTSDSRHTNRTITLTDRARDQLRRAEEDMQRRRMGRGEEKSQ
jgi:hypothetical protein